MQRINILGINVDLAPKEELWQKMLCALESGEKCRVVTVNPEIILKAIEDEEYFFTVNHSGINSVDGTGVKLAAWALGKNPRRFTGVEILNRLLPYCARSGHKVMVLNWDRGLSRAGEITDKLMGKFSGLKIKVLDIAKTREPDESIAKAIEDFGPRALISTLGNPEQEIVLAKLQKRTKAGLYIGVGGSIDFLTGRKKSAPRLFSFLGLEWLWRLYGQPVRDLGVKRPRRIYNAFVLFTLKFLHWRLILPFFYRSNVACWLYRRKGDSYEVLLVERTDEPGHWQLVQGGTGRLGLAEAGAKEISEELNTDKFKAKKTVPDLHKYRFGFTAAERQKSSYHRGSVFRKHSGYRGQKQGLWIGEYLGDGSEFRLNYWDHTAWKWVDVRSAAAAAYPSRREAMEKYSREFEYFIKEKNEQRPSNQLTN